MSVALLAMIATSSFLLLSGGAVPTTTGAAAPIGSAHAGSVAAVHLPAATHGDLVVGPSNSPFILSPATIGATTYFQQGNVTVQPGGRLYVDDLTFSFLQFIANTGNVGQRVSHLYNFTVQGLAVFNGSVLTTNVSVLNAFVRLTVNVTGGGTLVAQSSTFAFPGNILVNGAGSRFYANGSTMTDNAAIHGLIENNTLLHDTSYSPSLLINNSARATITRSSWLNYYGDNLTQYGAPGVNLTDASVTSTDSGGNATYSQLQLPQPVASSLALAMGYRSLTTGTIVLQYQAGVAGTSGPGSHLTYQSTNYPIPLIHFARTNTNVTAIVEVPVPGSLLTAINSGGLLAFLQSTGQFGSPSTFSLTIGAPTVGVSLMGANVQFEPNFAFNMAAGGGSNITVADSLLGLNWAALPGTPVDHGVPTPQPWASNKLFLSGGSHAYLANVSTPTPFLTVFDNQSIVVPTDAASSAVVFRWGQIQALSGAYGPIPAVQVAAFSAYAPTESNNATATALNNLNATDPDLGAYVASTFAADHRTTGVTDGEGNAYLLLAASVVNQNSLPTGLFLGSYHFGTTLAGGGANSTTWVYGGVSPYPLSMTPSGPDRLPPAQYPNYRAEIGLGAVSVLVDNVTATNSTVDLGQWLTVSVPITNVGTASLVNFTAAFNFMPAHPLPEVPLSPVLQFGELGAGQTHVVNFSWLVDESVIGLGGQKAVNFVVNTTWNGGLSPTGGATSKPLAVTVEPALISLAFTPPSGPLSLGNTYTGVGVLKFAGKGYATINVTLTGPGGSFLAGSGAWPAGTFTQAVSLPNGIQTGGTYTVTVSATYNHRTVTATYLNAVHIAGSPPAGPSFWATAVFGPITWLYLIIIIAAVAGGLAVLLFASGMFSRGKLVECGECGSLIAATATSCRNCGAEFETELVRCSRCGSTIPANASVCPECAAQLLGKPEGEGRDPERQGYSDFVERYRTEARKELQENYGEGAFWDWWKRQPSYVSFNQWKLQQAAGSRAGMTAPLVTTPTDTSIEPVAVAPSSKGSAGGKGGSVPPAAPRAAATPARTPPSAPRSTPAPTNPSAAPAAGATDSAPQSPGTGLRACSNCSKEIPSDFLVCPFCGAVTR
ncbi:MAG TPA: hypothetical protein VGV89_02015 [Thermoplasmata archaeon]|nr:hypothetical protein [Thermoplasmata archaeon]